MSNRKFDYFGMNPEDVAGELDPVVEELLGGPISQFEGDETGTNWSRGHWVSGHDIVQALIDTLRRNYEPF